MSVNACRIVFLTLLLPPALPLAAQPSAPSPVAIVIHGGAGTIRRQDMDPGAEAAYRARLEEALQAGHRVLMNGGSSLDAVVEAVTVLEASPLFNAGVGAVLTSTGVAELDASLMEGRTWQAGAVAGVRRIRHPIRLARMVMERSGHVLLAGEGAEEFARSQGVELVPNETLQTPQRREQLRRVQDRADTESKGPYGTVGAVALDRNGDLAAATSTGGMMNKRFGRIGDSPIIGAGTYADNETCAVSATGHGEYFIRGVLAYSVSASMRYGGLPLAEAAAAVIHGKLTAMGGAGGLIAMDRMGRIAMPFNTEGMYRGYIDGAGKMVVEMYRE